MTNKGVATCDSRELTVFDVFEGEGAAGKTMKTERQKPQQNRTFMNSPPPYFDS
jgi:hypothetical protein